MKGIGIGPRGVVWRKIENVPEFCGRTASGFDKNERLREKAQLGPGQKSGTGRCDGGQLTESKRENSGTAPIMVQLWGKTRGQIRGHSFRQKTSEGSVY